MKKAELQMQETILVIFIITIIIGLALFTFYQFQLKLIEKLRFELEDNKMLTLLSTLQNSPELSYSYLGNEENAMDTIKLINAKLINQGFKEITVKQIYPTSENKTCNIKSYPDCNLYLLYSNKPSKIKNTKILSLPVSLYFPHKNEYKAALLEVKTYS